MPETEALNPETAVPVALPSQRWGLAARIAFRFAFVYLLLYCWPNAGRSNLLDAIPNFQAGSMNDSDTQPLAKWAEAPSHALCSWVAVHVFHLTGPEGRYHPTGSGDTTLDYIQVFCFFVLAACVAVVWSIIDRRRPNYRTLYAWLRLIVRFTLAFTLLSYGFAKIYPLQFHSPFLSTLTETYGEASPMGLLWTFMGASAAYTMFCGSVEAIGGVLLLFRRTTAIGALVAAGAMLNVAMLNFCYDVPVKLYSLHLFLMSAFLLLPEVKPLWNFFLAHRTSRLESVSLPKFERRWLRGAAIVLQVLVVASVLFNNIWGAYVMAKDYAAEFTHPPLYGVWDVDGFTSGGPLPAAWHRVIVDSAGLLTVRTNSGDAVRFRVTFEKPKHLKLQSRRTKQTADLNYEQQDDQSLVLRGYLDHDPIVVQLHRFDASHFLLTSRGFHWINEDPFNR
jgi:hypothetical protein